MAFKSLSEEVLINENRNRKEWKKTTPLSQLTKKPLIRGFIIYEASATTLLDKIRAVKLVSELINRKLKEKINS